MPQFSPSEKIETSTKTSPQKCFSTVRDTVENNTKKANVIEKLLCKICFITWQNYKKQNLKPCFTKALIITPVFYNYKRQELRAIKLMAELKIF
jgi:hypothetical protein